VQNNQHWCKRSTAQCASVPIFSSKGQSSDLRCAVQWASAQLGGLPQIMSALGRHLRLFP